MNIVYKQYSRKYDYHLKKHFFNKLIKKGVSIIMAITKKQILMKKKYSNGDVDIIYPVNRPKDIIVGGGR